MEVVTVTETQCESEIFHYQAVTNRGKQMIMIVKTPGSQKGSPAAPEEGEREKFMIRQPPIGEKDDYDSENSWISDGLPSSSRRKRRGDGKGKGVGWREK